MTFRGVLFYYYSLVFHYHDLQISFPSDKDGNVPLEELAEPTRILYKHMLECQKKDPTIKSFVAGCGGKTKYGFSVHPVLSQQAFEESIMDSMVPKIEADLKAMAATKPKRRRNKRKPRG